MAIVIKNTKDTLFSNERPYMVVTFVCNYNSKFAPASMAETRYKLKYDLRLAYPQCRNTVTNVFDAETAAKLFIEELPVGSNENVNLFDLTIKEVTDNKHCAVKNHHNGVIMDTWYVACYHSEKEWAKKVALNDIETKINERKLSWAD